MLEFNLRESLADVKCLMDSSTDGPSWEERCTAIHRHYQALVRDYKRSEKRVVECQKKQLEVGVVSGTVCVAQCHNYDLQVSQHRDVIQTEYARVNVAKSKLENLCRELQKHSKAVAVSY